MSVEELEASHIARFEDLREDTTVFADINTPKGRRRHFHPISPGGHLGPASITTPHNFHMSYLEVPPGSSAVLHAHDAVEVFIPITGKFVIRVGDEGQQVIDMAPLDVISVPPRLTRTFENVGLITGILQVIYDGGDRVLDKIYQPEEHVEGEVDAKVGG